MTPSPAKPSRGALDTARGLLTKSTQRAESLARSPHALWALFALAFAESVFFPVPPDVLLVALAAFQPARAFRYAFVATLGSVAGAVLGYAIGYFAFESIGRAVVAALGAQSAFDAVGVLFAEHGALIVLAAAFTPIPFKVFTLAAGVWHADFAAFLVAALVGRGARFYLEGALFYVYGARIRSFVEQNMALVTTLAFLALLAIGLALRGL